MGFDPITRGLHDNLSFIIDNFAKVKEGNKIRGTEKPDNLVQLNDQVHEAMKDFVAKLKVKMREENGEEIELWSRYGRGQGNWPEVAWIALELAGSIHWNGEELSLPINIQFDDKKGGIYLTLLGYGKQLIEIYGSDWESEVSKLRDEVKGKAQELGIDGFNFDTLDAGHLRKGSDAYIMRLSYFMHKFYPASNIPTDDEIYSDIINLLNVQASLYDSNPSNAIQYWAVLPSEGNGVKGSELQYWSEWYQQGYVGIKWGELVDRYGEELLSMNEEEYSKAFTDVYGGKSMDDMAWKFLSEMAEGDVILINRGKDGIIAKGTISSDPFLVKGAECPIRRNVNWELLTPERVIPKELKGKFSRRVISLSRSEYDLIMESLRLAQSDLHSSLLLKKKQVILYGPPGTGKTYHTKLLALHLIRGG
jgi:hypothetical protein